MAPGLEADWKEIDATTSMVSLSGELDLAGAESLEGPLEESLRDGSLIVDLHELEFIDSAGLKALVVARRSARDSNRGFAVIRATGRAVKSVLDLTRASSQIPIFASIEEAQASF